MDPSDVEVPSNNSPSSETGTIHDITVDCSERVTLQVGERRFTTLRATLVGESEYFAARLSDRWDDAEEDGSYFVDSDPSIFEHILSYLRSGNFPVFFDSSTLSFDHAKYLSLLNEARYFGIRELESWIKKKKYLDVVCVTRSVDIINKVTACSLDHLNRASTGDTKVDVSTSWAIEKVYVCPRNVPEHYGDRSRCGQACEKARVRQGGDEDFEEEPIVRAVIITTKVTVNLDHWLGDQRTSEDEQSF
ncbi:BTB/POZ protein [Hypoxylon crocopeplum]|nr:BTB/POZ protein [Hypoxylon crocopeplum]